MSKENSLNCTILFADIARSTVLYEQLGNQVAQKIITTTVRLLSQITAEFNGMVIKTIGDEIMCRFEEAEHAVYAACAMNELLADKVILEKARIAIRIGISSGEVILENGDIFGDAVNLASRMTDLATANKVLLTKQTVDMLSAQLQKARVRDYSRERVKGHSEKVNICEIIWNPHESTNMPTGAVFSEETTSSNASPSLRNCLELNINNKTYKLGPEINDFEIGRASNCDINTSANLASRIHIVVNYQRGKFSIRDTSTNGTFLLSQSGKNYYIKRESMSLSGNGVIGLGQPIAESGKDLIYYKVI